MKKFRALLAASLLGNAAAAVADTSYSAVVAFGDSLSDNGNIYRIIDGLTPFVPNDGQPPLPYFFGRFSNGPTAVEDLAGLLTVPLTDFAVGGAKTGPDLTAPPAGPNDNEDSRFNGTGVLAQVEQALQQNRHLDGHALYVVWAGANDFFAEADLISPNTAPHAVDNLASAITRLYRHGARHFLVPGMPDLGLTPFLRGLGPQAAGLGTQQSDAFNQLLGFKLYELAHRLEHIDLKTFDTADTLRQAAADPTQFGFSNANDMCIADPSYACILDSFNAGPARNYVFWDDVHPTAAVHQLLAAKFLDVVTAAPAHSAVPQAKAPQQPLRVSGLRKPSGEAH
jgi:phospholipase/lecithinase/hemolysin